MATPLYDRNAALERLGQDEELLETLLAMFVSDGPDYLGAIDSARRLGDHDGLARAAHSLKGVLATFSAAAALRAAQTLESQARERAADAAIDSQIARVRSETERFLASIGPA